MFVRVVANPIGQDGAVTLVVLGGSVGVLKNGIEEENLRLVIQVGVVDASTRAERNR